MLGCYSSYVTIRVIKVTKKVDTSMILCLVAVAACSVRDTTPQPIFEPVVVSASNSGGVCPTETQRSGQASNKE